MKHFLSTHGRTLALIGVLVPLLALFVYVALHSGPLAPVSVTVAAVEAKSITPALFGIGTVEARYTHKIGPTFAGRVKQLDVNVGDRVKAGQLLGEMDPIDLDDRIRSQEAALKRAEAALREAEARQSYAQTQARRYKELFAVNSVSEEIAATKRQELQIADAALAAAGEDLARLRADRAAVVTQRSNLRLIAPVDGLVAARNADPGTTVVAGQAVVEVIDPMSLWINARFDQVSATGLAAGLPTRIVLRSRNGQTLTGHVLRVEPLADAVTEELLAKVVFDSLPVALPPVGELAEVTVFLPALAAMPVIPNGAVQRVDGNLGVWQIVDGDPRFTPVKLGGGDLDGYMQVSEGLKEGDWVIVYSGKKLTTHSRLHVVEHLPGVTP
ncbi:MAG: efflux RND transporter periplasmic adaptor subunit [Deltaproteobacteria bacterium]|nr:efflux RND transporter periplasmic adaptor subunit [Deltaproteobacteria bacterium]